MEYIRMQKYSNDCGRAVVCSVLGLLGYKYSYHKIENCKNFYLMQRQFEKYNIKTKGYYGKIIQPLCICQVKKFNHLHFIIVYQCDKKNIRYYYPTNFLVKKMSYKRFYKMYTGYFLAIETNRNFCRYRLHLFSLSYNVKLIIFDLFLLIIIYNLIINMI